MWTSSLLKPCAKIEPFSLKLLLLRYLVVIMVKVTFTKPWKHENEELKKFSPNHRSYFSAIANTVLVDTWGNRDFCFWFPCFALQACRSWLFYSTHPAGMEEHITSMFFLAASESKDFKRMHGVIMAIFSSTRKKAKRGSESAPSKWVSLASLYSDPGQHGRKLEPLLH